MKRTLVVLMLLLPVLASLTWSEAVEDRCDYEPESPDFIIYFNASLQGSTNSIKEIEVTSNIQNVKYVANQSFVKFSENSYPLIPGFEYPSLIPLYVANNYSFFVPIDALSGTMQMRVVSNNSDGFPRCKDIEWEDDGDSINDAQMDLSVSINFVPETKRFSYEIVNKEGRVQKVYFSVFSGNDLIESRLITMDPSETLDFESNFQYESNDVSRKLFTTYFVSFNGTHSFLKKQDTFDFYDFDLEIPIIPKAVPEESYSVDFNVMNVGSLEDQYDFSYELISENSSNIVFWVPSLIKPDRTIDSLGQSTLTFEYTFPLSQVGEGVFRINVTSLGSGLSKSYDIVVSPKKTTTQVLNVRNITEINAYSKNFVSLALYSSGTISPRVHYYVYTEPALLITDGIGSLVSKSGEINEDNLDFTLGGSCAMSSADSEGFNAGRKLLLFSNMIYSLSESIEDSDYDAFTTIYNLVDAEKLKMTSSDSNKLFSDSEKLLELLDDFMYGIDENETTNYFKYAREDVYLFTKSLEDDLQNVGQKMMESCTSVDNVDFHVYAIDEDTFQTQNVPIRLDVVGPKVLEFIGPTELKAISGDSVYFKYILKNNAGEAFEVELNPSDDIIALRSYIYLKADSSEEIELKIRAPDYFEVEDLEAYIEITTRTYSIKFPLTISVGTFNPKLTIGDDFGVGPNTENYENLTFRTGGIDDSFKLSYVGPSWVELPETFTTKGGEYLIPMKLSPPSSASGSEDIEITITPDTFPDYRVNKVVSVYVSSDAKLLLEQLDEALQLLESKKDLIDEEKYFDAKNYLKAANQEVSEARYSSAKLDLKRAKNIIFSVEETDSSNVGTIIFIILALVGFAFVFWKFLLPKIRGTNDEESTFPREVI